MNKLLIIKSSLRGADGKSSRLADEFVRQWARRFPNDGLTELDLSKDPVPHLDRQTFESFFVSPDERNPEQQERAALSDHLVEQFMASDIVVLGAPMYNYGIPSTLKAWLDHIARAGKTFRYTENGSEGLAGAKRVFVMSTRGGVYPEEASDLQKPYLKRIFVLMGIVEVNFVIAEGLDITHEMAARSLKKARSEIMALVEGFVPA